MSSNGTLVGLLLLTHLRICRWREIAQRWNIFRFHAFLFASRKRTLESPLHERVWSYRSLRSTTATQTFTTSDFVTRLETSVNALFIFPCDEFRKAERDSREEGELVLEKEFLNPQPDGHQG